MAVFVCVEAKAEDEAVSDVDVAFELANPSLSLCSPSETPMEMARTGKSMMRPPSTMRVAGYVSRRDVRYCILLGCGRSSG